MIQRALFNTPLEHWFTNDAIANVFSETAELLEKQGANRFRVDAYRRAAKTIHNLPRSVAHIWCAEGTSGLTRLPTIGRSLAHSIEQLICTGRLPLLERLRGEDVAERSFATVPDIGPTLARRIHEQLGLETLAELQAAANDGRLAKVSGMGRKRIRAVRESLAGRFQRPSQVDPRPQQLSSVAAPVAELIDVDTEYRRLAKQGKLPRIAPRRFNPTAEAWLPILHTEREGRHYSALYSNSQKAHEFGTTRDWVIVQRDDDGAHGQWTVITANYGKLRGQRIVRGREQECSEYYQSRSALPDHQDSAEKRHDYPQPLQ